MIVFYRNADDLIGESFPKIYYCDSKMIVMDNLLGQDYRMLPKLKKQDMHHAKSEIHIQLNKSIQYLNLEL